VKYTDIIQIAIRTLKANMLRSVLTLSIIAIGIAALIGILTSIDVLEGTLTKNFASLGSNTFTITPNYNVENSKDKAKIKPIISSKQAVLFKEKYSFPADVSINTRISGSAVVKNNYKTSNPNVSFFAVDDLYMKVTGKNLMSGRSFSNLEIENGRNVVVVGFDLANTNFENIDSVLGSSISIKNKKYTVIGITEKKGATAGKNDNFALVPYTNAQREFNISKRSFEIMVSVFDVEKIDWAIDEAIGVFRSVRKLGALDKEDFSISKSDKLANTLISQMSYISIATILIGILTLIGAGVGLMNIMLVSVNERTREIGLSKSLGATKKVIFTQFLSEAVILCLAGAFVGIVFGVLLGNALSYFIGSGFVFPVVWVVAGLVFSTVIGISAGLFPAIKASKMNPVDALRYV